MKKLSILLLEDDQLRVDQFLQRLNESGRLFELDHCETAKDAIEHLTDHQYDLIFLDHDLGGKVYVDFKDPKEDCGMRVAEWFSIRPELVSKNGSIIVHSLNSPAATEMIHLIGEAIYVPFLWTKKTWDKFLKF